MTKFIYKTCYFNQVISFYYFILTSRAWISRQGNYDIYKILKLVFLYFLPFLFFFFVFGLYKVLHFLPFSMIISKLLEEELDTRRN